MKMQFTYRTLVNGTSHEANKTAREGAWNTTWARIFKLLRSPETDFKEQFRQPFKESIPPSYVAWRAGTIALFLLDF
jgi:hypothetical protein